MKKIGFGVLILLFTVVGHAQQNLSYAYDAAGNRVSRNIVLDGRVAEAVTDQSGPKIFFEEVIAEHQLKIFPNPVESHLTIALSGYHKDLKGQYSLLNISGTILHRDVLKSENTFVDMSRYSKGTYVLIIQIEGQTTNWKIIKQ